MSKLEKYFIDRNSPIREAMRVIEGNDGKIALIVDENRKLLGTLTDGDIRRAVLAGHTLDTQLLHVMNKKPFFADHKEDRTILLNQMKTRHIRHIPIVDDSHIVTDIINMTDILLPESRENWVVIMAGGFGKRLMPLTENVPKPMLEVGGKPVLEILVKTFIAQGFHKFYISVNYLGGQIKDYFGNGNQYGIEIRYLEETQPLNTAGSLSLIEDIPAQPLLLINGDIVTNVKFPEMFDFHAIEKADISIGVREHKVQIPYGVVEIDEKRVQGFSEKPVSTHFVNTGIYVLNPDMLGLVPKNQPFSMPDLVMKAQGQRKNVLAFPVTESWLDIGRMEDFARAESVVEQIFSKHIKTS